MKKMLHNKYFILNLDLMVVLNEIGQGQGFTINYFYAIKPSVGENFFEFSGHNNITVKRGKYEQG